jgi:hypothetical protein
MGDTVAELSYDELPRLSALKTDDAATCAANARTFAASPSPSAV